MDHRAAPTKVHRYKLRQRSLHTILRPHRYDHKQYKPISEMDVPNLTHPQPQFRSQAPIDVPCFDLWLNASTAAVVILNGRGASRRPSFSSTSWKHPAARTHRSKAGHRAFRECRSDRSISKGARDRRRLPAWSSPSLAVYCTF